MNAKWKKIALITAPILVAGSVYAFTNAAASNEDNGITGKLVSTQTLTAEEIAALESAKPAPAAGTTTEPSVDMESINPFTVYTPPTSAPEPAAEPAPTAPKQTFSLDNVGKLELKTQTTLGELKLEFKTDDGEQKLEGQIGDRKIEVKGEQALDVLNKLLTSLGLQDSMTALLQGQDVQLDTTLAASLLGLEIELKDGRKIETKEQPNHDNGNHKGWDKAKKEKDKDKDKESKGKAKGKAKGKDKKDDDDDEKEQD